MNKRSWEFIGGMSGIAIIVGAAVAYGSFDTRLASMEKSIEKLSKPEAKANMCSALNADWILAIRGDGPESARLKPVEKRMNEMGCSALAIGSPVALPGTELPMRQASMSICDMSPEQLADAGVDLAAFERHCASTAAQEAVLDSPKK